MNLSIKKGNKKGLKTLKNNKNKKMFFLTFISLIITLLIIFTLYLKIDNFVINKLIINKLEIIGANSKVKDILYQNLYYLIGDKMSLANIKEVKNKVMTNISINAVSVRKNYPSTLEINVIEKKPLLIWQNDNDEFFIVNSEDKIVRRAKVDDYKKFILIEKGNLALEQSDKIRFIMYQNLDFLNKIKALIFNGYRWNILLNNGIIIKLPENNIQKAIDKLYDINNKYQILDRNIQYIDIRIPNKIFIMPKR